MTDQVQSAVQYALRANHFIYHDDIYRWARGDERSRICGVFDDQASAQAAWIKLEHETIAQRPLAQIADFSEMYPKKLAELDAWVSEQSGEHIADDSYPEQVLARLSAEQNFEFLQRAKIFSFELIQVPAQRQFYVCRFSKNNAYWVASNDNELDTLYQTILHDDHPDHLLKRYVSDFANAAYGEADDDEGAFELHGSLEELSHQPEQLSALIASHRDIRYAASAQILLLDYDVQILKLVYPLLKQPPLDIHSVNLKELFELQTKHNQRLFAKPW